MRWVVFITVLGCAVGPPPPPSAPRSAAVHPCRLEARAAGVALDRAAADLARAQGGAVIALGDALYACDCAAADRTRVAGAAERATVAGASEKTTAAGVREATHLAGVQESTRVGGAAEATRIGGAAEQIHTAGAVESTETKGASESVGLGGTTERARVAGAEERSALAGAAETTHAGGAASGVGCSPDRGPFGFTVVAPGGRGALVFDGVGLQPIPTVDVSNIQ